MILGDFIKQYRTQSGMNMQDFANKSGLSKAYISILERNYNPRSGKPPIPSLETIRAVASVIGMDFNDVIAALDGDQKISLDSNPAIAASNHLSAEEQTFLDIFSNLSPDDQKLILAAMKGMIKDEE